MKYYAVKEGKKDGKQIEPAIYTTWAECEAVVKGASGAVYKSFKSKEDAENYIKPDLSDKSLDRKNIVYIFVDGSYNKSENISGYGMAVVLNDEVVYQSKKTLNDKDFVQYRNVYGEVQGTQDAVEYAVKQGYKEVNVVYDYTGIENWAVGNWKANNPLTQGYAKRMKELSSKINVNFIKVKAHANDLDGGHKYNDLVDKLAKESVGI